MDVLPALPSGPTEPHPNVLALEFSWMWRPGGSLVILAQVPCLEPLCVLPCDVSLWERYAAIASGERPSSDDVALWMRWLELDRADAELEIGWAFWGDDPSAARVFARGAVPDRRGGWAVFRVAQRQGMVDVLLAGPAPPDGSPAPYRHLPVRVDLKSGS